MGGFGNEWSRSGDVLPTGGLGFRIFGFGVGEGSRFRLPAGRANISTRQWKARLGDILRGETCGAWGVTFGWCVGVTAGG